MVVFPIHHHLKMNLRNDQLDVLMLVQFGERYSHDEYPNHQRLSHGLVLPLDDLELLAIQHCFKSNSRSNGAACGRCSRGPVL